MQSERRHDPKHVRSGKLFFAFGLSTLLCSAACGPAETGNSRQAGSVSTGGSTNALTLDPGGLRYVAYRESWAYGRCPHFDSYQATPSGPQWIGSFRGSRLFDPAPETLTKSSENLPPRLRGYCSFVFVPSPNLPQAVGSFAAAADEASDIPFEDTPIVSSLEGMGPLNRESNVDHGAVFGELQLLAQEHWDYDPLAHALARPLDGPSVHVAIIDNAPYGSRGDVAPFDAPHARAITNVIRAIACPAGEGDAYVPCNISHSGHLALPQVSAEKTDYSQGGYFGTRGQVATAIVDAVNHFENVRSRGARHLILNLSLGWRADPNRLSPADRAVEDAIAYARCKGHLVIAAAGNRGRLFDMEKGPLFPAAFENRAAPSAATCAGWFDVPRDTQSRETGARDPLVFALGALDPRDEPIRATRVEGRPSLAAYGFLVTTQDTLPDAASYAMPPVSGSSVAAAAASGIAALIWSLVPDAHAAEVMRIAYDSGVDLETAAGQGMSDFPVLGGKYLPVHRLSMCRAVMLAAGHPLGDCRNTVPPYSGDVPTLDFWASAPSAQGTSQELDAAEESALLSSGVKTVLHEPWAGPQPTSPGCSTCLIANNTALYPKFPDPTAVLSVALTPVMQAHADSLQIQLTTTSDAGESTLAIKPPMPPTANFTVPIAVKGEVKSAVLTFHQAHAGTSVETYEQILVQ